MIKLLTANQFVNSILAMLKLSDINFLDERNLDRRFERAFETLRDRESELGVTPNFTFFTDPLHGNAAQLRNALLAAKENGLLSPDTSGAVQYKVKMDGKRAQSYLEHSPLSRLFLKELVSEHFRPDPSAATS
jgi:hypothetical protein